MARCAGSKPDGTPCGRIVGASQEYCFSHDPSRAQERRRNASRAGKSRPNRELAELRVQLSDLYTSVLTGMTEPKVGAVLAQIAGARTRLVETERKLRETEELEVRLEELETLLDAQKRRENVS